MESTLYITRSEKQPNEDLNSTHFYASGVPEKGNYCHGILRLVILYVRGTLPSLYQKQLVALTAEACTA